MKRVLIVALALAGLSTAGMAQTKAPTKLNEAPKMKVVSKTAASKKDAKVISLQKPDTKASPVVHPAAKKPAASTAVKTETIAKAKAPMIKKDGTPDKRFKKHAAASTPLKKDGTPDKRFKSNKAGN